MIKKWGGAFIVFILAMGACSKGAKDVREAAANRAPVEVTCQEFISHPPKDRWARMTGAGGTLREAAVRTRSGVADRLYVPLRCGGQASGPIRVVMATEDASLLASVAAKRDAEIQRDVVGMVRAGNEHDTQTTTGGGLQGVCAQCDAKIANLAADYVVIEDGKDPSMLRGLACLAGAIIGVGVLLKIVRS